MHLHMKKVGQEIKNKIYACITFKWNVIVLKFSSVISYHQNNTL